MHTHVYTHFLCKDEQVSRDLSPLLRITVGVTREATVPVRWYQYDVKVMVPVRCLSHGITHFEVLYQYDG